MFSAPLKQITSLKKNVDPLLPVPNPQKLIGSVETGNFNRESITGEKQFAFCHVSRPQRENLSADNSVTSWLLVGPGLVLKALHNIGLSQTDSITFT